MTGNNGGANGVQPNAPMYGRLENRLVLLGWLHRQLGYESTTDLLHDIGDADESPGMDWHSYMHHKLATRRVPERTKANLAKYDANIISHLNSINEGRREPFTLKYFQYLAVLYTEIFLDYYFNHRSELLSSLNWWVVQRNETLPSGRGRSRQFSEEDLRKLAFWMATGSGKTLIMHVNYRQFLHYNNESLDNILLVTPNEGLSKQHLDEMDDAHIPTARSIRGSNGSLEAGHNAVQVIEITKFEPEKRGKGASVTVDMFEGNNLIFVDEGHKGSGGKSWRDTRRRLGEIGFTFEYSATFGQALVAAKDDELVEEYGKAIAFDYHYRHFYNDGYGKDFHLVNLRQEMIEGKTDTLLLANLLSFYEQCLIFAEYGEELRPYNVEKPLWVFVGSSVQSVSKQQMHSDILTVVQFLHRLLAEGEWVMETIGRLLDGRSGLQDNNGRDIFHDKFRYLRGHRADAASIYADILKKVLHTDSAGGLHIYDIKGSKGELGLKAADSTEYFGLINIGDDSGFKKLVESKDTDIVIEPDSFAPPLFGGINNPNTIEILIGAKKFIEGWSSWRVSAMGLLNIGKREGSQIIQLFGRGVRLRGLDISLKRSSALTGIRHPEYIRPLETLNIFALNANYMAQFRDYLESEGAPVHGVVEVQLPIRPNHRLLAHDLVVPRLREGVNFADETLMLETDSSIKVVVDLSSKIDLMASSQGGVVETSSAPPVGQKIQGGSLELIDMSDIYVRLLEYKEVSKWHNMAVRSDAPAMILKKGQYEIVDDGSVLSPNSLEDVRHLQEAATTVVLEYAERFYHMRREKWVRNKLAYRTLKECDDNFQDYTIEIPDSEERTVLAVQNLIKEGDRIYMEETAVLPNVHFDRHLYLPLLLARENDIRIYPPGLNEGEVKFVRHLRDYCTDEKDVALAGKEIFLLRNLSKGKGIGFFETHGFYPDFILWVKSGGAQRIVFIEPHGMYFGRALDKDEKVRLHHKMRKLTAELGQEPGMTDVTLDSYIVSMTKFEDLEKLHSGDWSRERFAKEHHILFPERTADYDYLAKIIHGDGIPQP